MAVRQNAANQEDQLFRKAVTLHAFVSAVFVTMEERLSDTPQTYSMDYSVEHRL